jgi:lipopolysaccharide biosynthesis glycosyltransferase
MRRMATRNDLIAAEPSCRRVDPSAGNPGEEILVGFGVDDKFACHLAVTVMSVVREAPRERFRFIVIHNGISDETMRNVECCAPGQRFEWHGATDGRLLKLSGRDDVSQATYYRLLLPEVAPAAARRMIYLDCDVIVCRSLRELWEFDLEESAIGAVFDAGVDAIAFARSHGLPVQRLGYFNAGVMLLDISRINDNDLFTPVIDFLGQATSEPRFLDQDALNVAFWKKWAPLNPMWNVQRRLLLRSAGPCFPEDGDLPQNRRPAIIHYTERWKPWLPGSYHPFMWAYFRMAMKTPYWPEIALASKATRSKLIKWRVKHALLQTFPGFAYEPRLKIESSRDAGGPEP